MMTGPSIVRRIVLFAGIPSIAAAACAVRTPDGFSSESCGPAGCADGSIALGADARVLTSDRDVEVPGNPARDAGEGPPGAESGASVDSNAPLDVAPRDPPPTPDAARDAATGGWIDMSTGATACKGHPGAPCGWTAANEGAGYTCACRHGDWAEGWTCEPPNAPVKAGPSCP